MHALATPQQNYQRGSLYTYQIRAQMSTFKKNNCLTTTYRNILIDNTKILHTDNDIKKLKILESLYIKFRQPTINRNNFEMSDILK